MARRFEGKTALVTGGSRGIGKSIVEALLKEGAKVYALAKSAENLEKLKSELPSVNIIQVDLCDWESTRNAVQDLSVVDLLVNNAGGTSGQPKPFYEMDKEEFENVIAVNCNAAFNISQVISKGLISAGRPGVIVNMSSVIGLRPYPKCIPYCVSKAMLEMLTKCMALELGPYKIRVNSINPTVVLTEMVMPYLDNDEIMGPFRRRSPTGKFAELKDVVDATLFLLSDDAAMITGTSLPVDGGFLIG